MRRQNVSNPGLLARLYPVFKADVCRPIRTDSRNVDPAVSQAKPHWRLKHDGQEASPHEVLPDV